MKLSTFAYILAGVLLNATAQLLLKTGTNAMGGAIHLNAANWLATGVKAATELPILAGLACYAVSVLVWIIALSRTDVTIAYPMLALGYAVSALGAWLFLGEVVSAQRVVAIGVIMAGVLLLSQT